MYFDHGVSGLSEGLASDPRLAILSSWQVVAMTAPHSHLAPKMKETNLPTMIFHYTLAKIPSSCLQIFSWSLCLRYILYRLTVNRCYPIPMFQSSFNNQLQPLVNHAWQYQRSLVNYQSSYNCCMTCRIWSATDTRLSTSLTSNYAITYSS